jgi:hypothetical protein
MTTRTAVRSDLAASEGSVSDLTPTIAAIRARVRAEVTALKHDDVGDNLPDKLSSVPVTPAIYVLARRVNATELTPGSKVQKVELEVIVGVITQSFVPGGAALAAEPVGAAVIKALHFWPATPAEAHAIGLLEKLKYRGESGDPLSEPPRFGVQHRFRTSIHDTYTA